MGFEFQYMKVETSEGNGVIHALFHSAFSKDSGLTVWVKDAKTDEYQLTDKYYDAIHAYFSCLWKELHQSPIVWCSVVDQTQVWSRKAKKWITLTKKRVSRYIVQYTVKQKGFLRRANSFGWIFRGWRKRFLQYIDTHGFKKGIQKWSLAIRNRDWNPNPPPTKQTVIWLE